MEDLENNYGIGNVKLRDAAIRICFYLQVKELAHAAVKCSWGHVHAICTLRI